MAYDRFLIAPFDDTAGLTTNMRPWQIPDNAWAVLQNMYVFRGRLKKRFGSRYMGSNQLNTRLRLQIGTSTITTGSFSSADIRPSGTVAALGQAFSIGTTLFTVFQANGALKVTKLTGSSVATGTFNISTGALTITGNGENPVPTAVFWYPALPVMGISQYEFTAINDYATFAFDPYFAYTWTGTAWALSNNSPTWHGSDTDFFWSYNWVGPNAAANALTRAMFTTNFHVKNINGAGDATDDPVYYWDGSTWTAYKAYLNPGAGNPAGTGPFVETARIIVPFHGRLVYLNTIENDGGAALGTNTNYVNRARYTSVGSPFSIEAWYGVGATDITGRIGQTAGFEDASTLEAIISAEFIKDRLIVYFEESTWELVYQGNEQRPFEWQKLNTELGSMATFSTIPFDKAVLTIGETGVHSCNGSNVARIDQKIPDEVFDISNVSTQTQRICGIRDYFDELVYWAVPQEWQMTAQPYPSKVLIYNYQNQTWAYADDCFTAFGYWDGNPKLTWATLNGTWDQWNTPWNAGNTGANVRQIIAGNQEGFVSVLVTDSEEESRNAGVLQITNMTAVANGIQLTIYNHMLDVNPGGTEYIYIENAQGVILSGFQIYEVIYVDQNTVIASYPSEVVNAYGYFPTFTGTYTGGGTAARVSNYRLESKQWNPYDKDGRNVYIAKIDFAVLRTTKTTIVTPGGAYEVGGEVVVNYSPSSSALNTLRAAEIVHTIMGTGILETSPYPANLYPLEQIQNRLWHPVYLQVDGECIQIQIYMNPLQICTPKTAFADLQIEGLILNTKAVSSRLQ